MDRKSFFVVIIGLTLLLAFIVYRNKNQRDLKINGTLLSARITGVNLGGKTSGGFDCLLSIKNKIIETTSPSSLKRGKFDFIGKTFPAMYSPNTNTCEILITPIDFEKFNIPFPDSLNWVMEYVLEK